MPDSLPDFRPILAALSANNVRFVVIGGLAMTAHGSSHVTQDIDLGYSRSRENIQAMTRALAEFKPRFTNFPGDLPFVWDERTLRAAANVTLDTKIPLEAEVTRVDLLSDIPGITSFEELWDRSVETELYGMAIRIASLDDLIAMKRTANRPKDQGHLLELLALKQLIEGENSG